ncbi:MAG: ABC transporter permease [Eubacteriales bacterium]
MNVRKATSAQKAICSIISILFFLSMWYVATNGTELGEIIPSPIEVIIAFINSFTVPIGTVTMESHMLITFSRFFVGFVLAIVFGIIIGLTMGWYPVVNAILGPIYQIIRPVPILAWIPIGIIWFGLGEETKYFIVFLGAFMSITQNSFSGAKSVDPTMVNASKMLGANDIQLFFTVVIPASTPMIFAGLHTAAAVGWASVVAAEMVRAESGIGWMIMAGKDNNNMVQILVGIIGIAIIGFLLAALMRKLEEHLCRWSIRGK